MFSFKFKCSQSEQNRDAERRGASESNREVNFLFFNFHSASAHNIFNGSETKQLHYQHFLFIDFVKSRAAKNAFASFYLAESSPAGALGRKFNIHDA